MQMTVWSLRYIFITEIKQEAPKPDIPVRGFLLLFFYPQASASFNSSGEAFHHSSL